MNNWTLDKWMAGRRRCVDEDLPDVVIRSNLLLPGSTYSSDKYFSTEALKVLGCAGGLASKIRFSRGQEQMRSKGKATRQRDEPAESHKFKVYQLVPRRWDGRICQGLRVNGR